MGKLNTKMIEAYNLDTGNKAIYNKNGMTMHTIAYVNWLEERIEKNDPVCESHLVIKSQNPHWQYCATCGGRL
jgi:hypothetical protein